MSIVRFSYNSVFLEVFFWSIILDLLDASYSHINSKRVDKKMKNILLWNAFYTQKDHLFGLGSQPFEKSECNETQCFMTVDHNYTSIKEFDAIVFHGPHYTQLIKNDFPQRRSTHQLYVYYSYESPSRFSIDRSLNGLFNVTITHRLDSDIPFQYFALQDLTGRTVAPTLTPNWTTPTIKHTRWMKYKNVYRSKSKSVAWFVSNCRTPSRREDYVAKLKTYIWVDIFGDCDELKCSHPISNARVCLDMLRKEYFFYLAFENSLCKDYITEKALTALDNYVVPIVYGGADLDRFLPPMSYIDATKYHPRNLSTLLKSLMNSQYEYSKYFWWREFYRIVEPVPTFCSLCDMLHDTSRKPKQHHALSVWWHNHVCIDGHEMLRNFHYI